ncbi:MAG: hypothetical protein INR70_07315 [Parafilimonas terrae]|nr:hypothetical protein [Parafilimonas terrae]
MREAGLPRRAAAAIAVVLVAAPAAAQAVRLPVPDGTYCGADGSAIVVDSRADTVAIAGYTCGSPILAADKLQSIQCRRGDGPPERREFDVRVLDDALLYNGRWFRRCRP